MKLLYKIGLIVLMGLGLGCAKIHYSYPPTSERILVRMYSSDKITPNYRLNVKKKDSKSIEKILDILENVPDVIQKIGNVYSGSVVIFDGKITDNESMRPLKGRRLGKIIFDDLSGVYLPSARKALVEQNYEQNYPLLPVFVWNYMNTGI